MKKVIETLEKEIEKKRAIVTSIVREAGKVEEGFEVKIFDDFLDIIEVSKKEFEELKKLEKIRRFINTLDDDDKLNEKVVEKKKRGRPRKNDK